MTSTDPGIGVIPGKNTAPRPRRDTGLRSFRPDIQGLRAVGVLLVVLYHADIPFVRAGYVGVDVFFVISGFLITGALLREVERTGRISFVSFFAGRTRRLLAPAVVMVLITLVATRLWASVFQVKDVGMDAIWSAFYLINYRLAAQGIDYQQSSAPPSPLQHMWSLAVEEQFYLVWPLLIMGCVVLARRRLSLPQVLVPALLVVTATSLWFSVVHTVENAPLAYFSLHTRAWELAAGALVYLAATRLTRLPAAVAAVASWVGVAGIVASAFVFSDDTAFPGTAALLPVGATALVIAAGCRPSRGSAELLLDLRVLQGLGKVSYSWYLWHWPLVVLVPLFAGYPFGWPLKLEVMALALWVAVLSYFAIEAPSQRSRMPRPKWLGVGFAATTAVVASGAVVVATLPALVGSGQASAAVRLESPDTGVVEQALAEGLTIERAPSNLTPSLTEVVDDQPESSSNGCHAGFPQVAQAECVFGDPAGVDTLMLIGDSHAQQWLPAFDAVGEELGWKVISLTKGACPIADVTVHSGVLGRPYTECDAWREQTIDRVAATQPDLVVMSASDSVPGTQVSNSEWADATLATVNQVRADGTPVVYLMDTPVPVSHAPDCVARSLDDIGACTQQRADAYPYEGRHEQMATTLALGKVATVEPLDMFCTETSCPLVVGNLMVYRDEAHVTTAYAEWLSPMVRPLFIAREDR